MVARSVIGAWLAAAALAGQQPTASEVVELLLGVRPGLLRYDRETLQVPAGARVRLTLVNADEMLHNWVLCRQGTDLMRLAADALALGDQAIRRHFVPASDAVLCHTEVAWPGKQVAVEFTAPAAEGAYPFVCTLPGHAATMRGMLRVGEPPRLQELRYRVYLGEWRLLPDFAALSPVAAGEVEGGVFDLAVADGVVGEHDFGMVFEGRLQVPESAGVARYRFYLSSDDGSRLWVDGRAVCTYDGVHAASEEQVGEIELGPGGHDVRLEFFQHLGGSSLVVAWESDDMPRAPLSREVVEVEKSLALMVLDEAVVQRVFLADGPVRAIAVGLPGGVSFCFDADAVAVAQAWRGGFLDVGPDRHGRGGKRCRPLGGPFATGLDGFPLRFVAAASGHGGHHAGGDDAPAAAPRFLGYRREPEAVQFLFEAGGRRGTWRVSAGPGGVGLRHGFAFEADPGPLTFTCDEHAVTASCDTGTPGGRRFTVTLLPR